MKVQFLSATTIANVTRLGFFEKGSNASCLAGKTCDMNKLVFSFIWADNEEFIDECECKFKVLYKKTPNIKIEYDKSLLACEEPSFKWQFDNIANGSYDKIQIHDILFVLGIAMINSQYLFELLPPFDTISMFCFIVILIIIIYQLFVDCFLFELENSKY